MSNTSPPIYTVGYGRRSLDALIALLQAHAITFVIDVRSAPYSRYKPEFSRPALEESLRAAGLRYVYLGDALGGQPADPNLYHDGKVDYDLVKQQPAYQQGLQRLHTAQAQGRRVVLLCSEGRPEQCHRSKLIGASLAAAGVPVVHLDENDAPQSQAAVIERLTGGQLSLFGDPSFTSRHRYDRRPQAEAEEEEDA